MVEILDAIRSVLALVVSLVLVGLCIAYGVLFRWRRTVAGTAVFMLLSSLAAAVIVGLVNRALPDGHLVRSILSLFVICYVAYALGWLGYALFYNWRRAGLVLDLERRARDARGVISESTEERS